MIWTAWWVLFGLTLTAWTWAIGRKFIKKDVLELHGDMINDTLIKCWFNYEFPLNPTQTEIDKVKHALTVAYNKLVHTTHICEINFPNFTVPVLGGYVKFYCGYYGVKVSRVVLNDLREYNVPQLTDEQNETAKKVCNQYK